MNRTPALIREASQFSFKMVKETFENRCKFGEEKKRFEISLWH